jgi:hypothetical protein
MTVPFGKRKIVLWGMTFSLPALGLLTLAALGVGGAGWGVVTMLRSGHHPAERSSENAALIAVDSFSSDGHSLARWTLDETRTAGWIDTITVEPGGGLQVSRDDQMLVVGGWAGETVLGARASAVLLSLCDTLIGVAPVNRPRLDVAEKVHPNLSLSGWQARLLVGHLPRCEGSHLEAWTVYPDGPMLLPLEGRVRITLPPRNEAISLAGFAGQSPVTADMMPRAQGVMVEVDKTMTLTRIPVANGPVLFQVGPGRYPASQLEEQDGWLLLVIKGKGGWLRREAVRLSR